MMISPSLNIIIVSIILNVLMMVAVILRFRARHLQRAAFGVDDWTIVIAAVSACQIARMVPKRDSELSAGTVASLNNRHRELYQRW